MYPKTSITFSMVTGGCSSRIPALINVAVCFQSVLFMGGSVIEILFYVNRTDVLIVKPRKEHIPSRPPAFLPAAFLRLCQTTGHKLSEGVFGRHFATRGKLAHLPRLDYSLYLCPTIGADDKHTRRASVWTGRAAIGGFYVTFFTHGFFV